MNPFRAVYAWLGRQGVTIKAAIITGVIAVAAAALGATIGPVLTYYLSRPEAPPEIRVKLEGAPFRCPPLDKLSSDQQKRLKAYRYCTTVELPNDHGFPLLQVVVTIPAEGIVEVITDKDQSTVSDFDGRIVVPVIEPLKVTTVVVWHKEILREGEVITFASPSMKRRGDVPISYQKFDGGASWYRNAFYILLVVLACAFLATLWSYPVAFFRWLRGPTPPPPPTP